MREIVSETRQSLENEREDVLAVIDQAKIDGRVYQERRVRLWLAQVETWLRSPSPLPSTCEYLERFTNEAMITATTAGESIPTHEFFDLCDRLKEIGAQVEAMLEHQWVQIKRDLLVYLRKRLPERKQHLNRFAYDDLLQNALRAMNEDNSGLVDSLAQQYPIVLIDEFQDTDPTQYAIFQHLHESEQHQLLCLIGDPKQAIYAFRGGDIFTYTHARSKADHLATLSENWRSSAGLIRAVNTIYQAGTQPFWTDAIRYHHVRPAYVSAEDRQRTLTGEDAALAPMQIWQLSGARNAYQTDQQCVEATCQEIARLIQLGREGALEVNGRPLQPSDIAILIRSHFQATGLQRRLQEMGVRTVSYDRQHIFKTLEAENLEVFLRVLAAPRDENLLKALLLSELMGFSEQDLKIALTDEGRWGALLETMSSYRTQWKTEGFIVMFRRFLREEHLPQRLLALPNGERRLTNTLHLSELTEEAQASMKLSIHATLQWYREQRESTLSEEKELRLESDDDRVKILTIHRSKGLEFPVVFM
ncbi:MAG: UvrD-helicase domain-containing protein, partial [Verrucomicrobiales bacterium]